MSLNGGIEFNSVILNTYHVDLASEAKYFLSLAKKRIQIQVSDNVLKELNKLAEIRGLSLSSLSHELIEEALELQEDTYFSRLGDQALSEMKKRDLVSHEDVW